MRLIQADREAIIGGCVVIAFGLVLSLAYAGGRKADVPGYDLIARFNKADGVSTGTDVRLAGVSIGKVSAQGLDEHFRAVLTLRVAPATQLPTDSAAVIETDGLLGAKFITLQPGGDDTLLKPGQEFQITQDSMNLEDILNQVIAQAEAKRADSTGPGGAGH